MKKRPVYIVIITFFLLSGFVLLEKYLMQVEMPTRDNPMVLYSTRLRVDLERTLAEAIGGARESVWLMIYSLSDNEVIEALNDKAAEGVFVKVISDKRASSGAVKRLGDGVEVVRRRADGLMHLKILVVDKRMVFLGSANMTRSSLVHQGNLMVGMDSPEMAEMIVAQAMKMKESNRMGGGMMRFDVGDQAVELWFLPSGLRAVERIKGLIRSAEKSIQVAMFTWTRRDFAEEVIAAKQRGVDVEVALDHHAARGSGKRVVKMLCEAGVPVILYNGEALLHDKMMVIDGKTLVNGSANWTVSAFKKNDDCFVVLYQMTEKQRDKVDRLWYVIEKETDQVCEAA